MERFLKVNIYVLAHIIIIIYDNYIFMCGVYNIKCMENGKHTICECVKS